jgi:hypothetical protein
MKKFLFTLTLISLLLLPFSSVSAYDERVGDFRLTFDGSAPWFADDNVFAPGETKTKNFKVYNYGSTDNNLFFISSASGNSELDSKFRISIIKDGSLIFSKLLSDISSSTNNQEVLASVSANSSSDYQFNVKLKKQLGDSYQGQRTSKIGFSLGYGGFGPEPETVTPVFTTAVGGDVAGSQEDEIGNSSEQEKDQLGAIEDLSDEEQSSSQVAGEQAFNFFSSYYFWIILFILLLIIALIVYRYLFNRNQEEEL